MTKENFIYFLFYFLLTILLGLLIPTVFAGGLVFTLGIVKEVIYDQANGGVSDLYNILANPIGIIMGWFLLSMV